MNFIFRLFKISILAALCVFVSGCGEKTPAQIEKEKREKIELAVKRASVLLFENNCAKAIEILEKTSAECGVSAALCEALANAYAQNKQPGSAAIFFDRASDLKGGDAELQISSAKSYEQSGALESAVKSYEKYLKMRPQDMVGWKTLGNVLEQLKRYEEAMNAYMAAIKTSGRNPNSAEAATVGNLFLKLNNMVQAKRWLEAAYAATSPDNVKTRSAILLGLIQISLVEKDVGKLDGYVAALEKIDSKVLSENYPDLRAKIDEFKKALKDAQDALDAEKQKAQAEKDKIAAEEKAKQEAEKLEAEKKKAEEQAKADAEKQKAEAVENKKPAEGKDAKSSDAEQSPSIIEAQKLDEIAEKAPKQEPTPVEKVYSAIESKDFKAAEQNAHKAVAQDSESAETWTALSKAYEAQGKDNDAFLAANEALVRNPENIDATLYFLRTASKVQNNEQFLNSLYAAQKKFPYNAEIIIGLARTYKEMNDKKNSQFFYRTFLRDIQKTHPRYEEIEKEFEDYSTQK